MDIDVKPADIIEILEWHPSMVEHGKDGLFARIQRVIDAAVFEERNTCINFLEKLHAEHAERHNYYRYAANKLRERSKAAAQSAS
jgi:hypothetical protein